MDIIYILVPLSIVLLGIAVSIFFWAVKAGQFDDLESPAHKILFDDDDPQTPRSDAAQEPASDSPDSGPKP